MILAVRIGNISRFTIWRKWWILNRCGSSTFFTAIRRPLTVNSYLDRYMIRVLRYPHQYDLKKTNSAHKFSHRCIRNIITGRNRQGAGWRFPRRPHPSAISRGPHHFMKKLSTIFHFYRNTWIYDCKNTLNNTDTHTDSDIHPQRRSDTQTQLRFWILKMLCAQSLLAR